ncbi:tetratricopeptide repeat protein [Rhizobiaceae bacterium n13]|uniref:Tetratricopeptide repeat protein n=1 Tax=Ferirhizobium litorale TaxID=2927786 RepID=A0AAE3Q9E5_9HYPH|nr:tetratricopeptide repeat protein [Fererhizobium litorale]MDI7860536.1 tetratricopeptide repeat protein [Fererhizobium litorale]MDI7920671.1 tetratricopeptide repeat protein [Fererhizobium litorale]
MFAMRCFYVHIIALGLGLIVPLAVANDARATEVLVDEEAAASLSQAQQLDKLFGELKRQRDPDRASITADQIRIELSDSGSATVNLLLQWSDKAASEKRNSAALDFLDQVTVLKPGFAEGWNRRAKLHFAMGNYRKAMSDLNRVLTIEPRHFGAVAGMALILANRDNDALTLRAWERFLEIYPADRRAQEQVDTLSEKLAGSRI